VTDTSTVPIDAIADEVLTRAIEEALSDRGSPHAVVRLQRIRSQYATSFMLEEVTADLDDGSRLDLMLKNLSASDMTPAAKRAKPAFLLDPEREIEVYRSVLAPHKFGPLLYAASADARTRVYWLLIEKFHGRELYQCGDLDAWIAAARWLSDMHQRLGVANLNRSGDRFIMYDRTFYRTWMQRAERFFLKEDRNVSPTRRAALRWLSDRYKTVVDRLLELPLHMIHGEFYPSNVLVTEADGGWRVCPIDWEAAAFGPGLIDVAALTLGRWRDDERHQMIAGYIEAAGDNPPFTIAEAVEIVDYCQIHLSVQWLGWFGRRRPPAAHASDWLSEALIRAERLGI
jgi:hypothetical protein